MKLTFALLIILFSNYSIACSCIGDFKIKSEVAKHEFIFSGKVLSQNEFPVESDSYPGMKFWNVEYDFEIQYIYKGKAEKSTVKLITGLGNGDCGFRFEVGKNYIVYSDYYDELISGEKRLPFLTTNICTRTDRYAVKEDNKIRRILKLRRKDTSGNNG